jgi:ADP-heptose:LPS heptosyltransferase
VKRILIFRTDRIGDFLICSSIYSSLKRNFNNSQIDIVCSNLNYEYIKSFNFFNKVFLYPNTIIQKIVFFFSLRKYDKILVLDGKKRSIYISIFKKSKFKILFTPSKIFQKIFKTFFNSIFFINYKNPKIDLIKKCLIDLNCDFNTKDLNFLKFFENNSYLNYNIPDYNFIVLNFDEKWIYNKYIKTYKNIEPSYKQFLNFLRDISKNENVIITNGYMKNPIIDKLKVSINNNFNKKVIIKDKINIFELQQLIKNCKLLISCHGAPTHMAAGYNIKLIDIIDFSEKDFFESYNYHFINKSQLFRESFDLLSNKILNIVNSSK